MKKQEKEYALKSVQGKCRFCGQFMALEVPESWNEIDIEEEATKKCGCAEAKEYTQSKERTANGERTVKDIFKDHPELDVLKNMLLKYVKTLCEHEISGITVKKGTYKCTMKPSKDGVKISLEQKTVDSIES